MVNHQILRLLMQLKSRISASDELYPELNDAIFQLQSAQQSDRRRFTLVIHKATQIRTKPLPVEQLQNFQLWPVIKGEEYPVESYEYLPDSGLLKFRRPDSMIDEYISSRLVELVAV